MSKYIDEGLTRVSYAPAVGDVSAPTVAEAETAGTHITEFLTKDGLNIALTQNTVDNSGLHETFDAQLAGSWGGSITLIIKRDNSADTAWDLWEHGDNGFIVVRRGFAYATAFVAADKVEVYPVQSHEPVPNTTAANQQARATAMMVITAQPDLHAAVAA